MSSSCANQARLNTVKKLLSILGDTQDYSRPKYAHQIADRFQELAENADDFVLNVHLGGVYRGAVDAGDFLALSWPEFNGHAFEMSSQEIVGLDCLSDDTMDVSAINSISTQNGLIQHPHKNTFTFGPNHSSFVVEWNTTLPEFIGLKDESFDPRMFCDTALLRCSGSLFPFDSLDHCYNVVSTLPQSCEANYEAELGINGFFQGDTLSCRYVELTGSIFRPADHCFHLSDISSKCQLEQCPNTRRLTTPIELGKNDDFDPTSPLWFLSIQFVILALFLAVPVATFIFYRRVRGRAHSSDDDFSSEGYKKDATDLLPILELEDMSFSWKEESKGIIEKSENFVLGGCKITCVVAPTGSGKTTFLKILAGFQQNHMKLVAGEFKSKPPIIMCHQDQEMWPDEMKVRDVLLFACTLYGSRFEDFVTCFKELDISKLYEQCFYTLSGGQKQLVNIASVIVQSQPTLIFLDEPLAALDEKTSLHLLRTLKTLPLQHSFVITVHMYSDDVFNEFDRYVPFGCHSKKVVEGQLRASVEEEEDVVDVDEGESPPRRERANTCDTSSIDFATLSDCSPEASDGPGSTFDSDRFSNDDHSETGSWAKTYRGICAGLVLWHSQYLGYPFMEAIVILTSVNGGSLIGLIARGSLVDGDTDYISTQATSRIPLYVASGLLGIAIITSFGVSLVYGSREDKLVRSMVAQKSMTPGAYVTVVFVRSLFFGTIQAISWFIPLLFISGLDGTNSLEFILNASFYGASWTCFCSFVALATPAAYSAQVVVVLDCYSLLMSGIMYEWDTMSKFFQVLHYINILFYYCSNGSHLLLEDYDTKCDENKEMLHPSQCASGQRVLEMYSIQQITSQQAIAAGVCYFAIALAGFFFVLRRIAGYKRLRGAGKT